MNMEFTWPEVFSNPDLVKTREPASLCADAIEAWGLCHVSKAPESFGETLIAIRGRIGMWDAALAENFTAFAKAKGWLPQ